MKLKLEKPIIFFDLETTGLDREKDQIVEISVKKIFPNGDEIITTRKIKPTIPIPKESSDIHGITEDDVKDCPIFASIAKALYALIDGCDLFGYNIRNFDVPLLYNEFSRAGITWDLTGVRIVDSSVIFKRKETRDLTSAYKFFCGKDMIDAHSAEQDVNACHEVFLGQIERYEDLPNDIESLSLYSNYDMKMADVNSKFVIDADGDYVINFGKNKTHKAKDELPFLLWMTKCTNPPFPNDTLEIAFSVLNKYDTSFNQAKEKNLFQ